MYSSLNSKAGSFNPPPTLRGMLGNTCPYTLIIVYATEFYTKLELNICTSLYSMVPTLLITAFAFTSITMLFSKKLS